MRDADVNQVYQLNEECVYEYLKMAKLEPKCSLSTSSLTIIRIVGLFAEMPSAPTLSILAYIRYVYDDRI